MAKIPTLDSRRVIVLSIISAVLALWGGISVFGSVLMEGESKTVFQAAESKIVGETGVILICSSLLILSILLAAALVVKEMRVQNSLSRQLLKAYGHNPDF